MSCDGRMQDFVFDLWSCSECSTASVTGVSVFLFSDCSEFELSYFFTVGNAL